MRIIITGTKGNLGGKFNNYCKKKIKSVALNNFDNINVKEKINALIHFHFFISKKKIQF